MVETNVPLVMIIACLVLLLAVHAGFAFRSVVQSDGPWKGRFLRWGSFLLIPVCALIIDQQSRFRSLNVIQVQAAAQYWGSLVQIALQSAGLVVAFAGIAIFFRGLFSPSGAASISTALLAIFIGWFLVGGGHWSAAISAGLIAATFMVQQFLREQRNPDPTKSSHPASPNDNTD